MAASRREVAHFIDVGLSLVVGEVGDALVPEETQEFVFDLLLLDHF